MAGGLIRREWQTASSAPNAGAIQAGLLGHAVLEDGGIDPGAACGLSCAVLNMAGMRSRGWQGTTRRRTGLTAGRRTESRTKVEIAGCVIGGVGIGDVAGKHLLALSAQQQRIAVKVERVGHPGVHRRRLQPISMRPILARSAKT